MKTGIAPREETGVLKVTIGLKKKSEVNFFNLSFIFFLNTGLDKSFKCK